MKIAKQDGNSVNKQEAILELLKQNASEIFSEDKIDVKQLRATLGEEVLADTERYGLNWAGKMDCFRTIQETTTNTLKPVREESVDFDNTENLFIEGDNLEVLKVLQKSYYGKVKMVYIDPPYNTGNDFIYNDKFSRNKREYLEEVGAVDKEGNVVNAGLYTQNTRDSGHFHSDWLNMMYPRLFLAKNLLRQDGVIFVSIDDNEVNNLRTAMNEIFGEENFVGQLIVRSNPRGSQEPYGVSSEHEYILVFSKTDSGKMTIIGAAREGDDVEFNFTTEDNKLARLLGLRKRGGDWRRADRPNMYFPLFVNPSTNKVSTEKNEEFSIEVLPLRPDGEEGRWTWGKDTAKERSTELLGKKIQRKGIVQYDIYRIDLLQDEDGNLKREKLKSILENKAFNYQSARQYFKVMFGTSELFDFPKPPELIQTLMSSIKDNDYIVLDFFAGSGTTAHAVMQLNAEDGGNRKYVCVQLPEKCKPETEAAKAGFVTIADIAKERIRRAGKKIQEEYSEKKIDAGFKVFKLDESNFKIWNTHVTSVEQLEQQMIEMFDNVQPGSTKEAMMYELILKSGKELNVAIEEKTAGGEKYFRINDGSIVICLADKLSKELFTGILVDKPKKIIVLDKSFGNDDQLKTNLLLQAEGAGVDEIRVI